MPFQSVLERTIYAAEHEQFRESLRRFISREISPNLTKWERQGHVDRQAWLKAGAAGFLCMSSPQAYGGAGADYRFCAMLREEMARAGVSGTALGMGLHSDVIAPFLLRYGTEAQKQKWLPPMARGEVIASIGMTEPNAGSDLKAIRTSARREGDEYVINGSKIFITNGWQADLVILVVKTDASAGARGVSLVLVEAGRPGFTKGEPLHKLSLRMEDTCELFFHDVRVPASNLLGEEEGRGFAQLMGELPWERLQIAISAQSAAEAALDWTIEYVKQRQAFGAPLMDLQNTRFKLAECATEVQIGRVFIDRCIESAAQGRLGNEAAAMAKYWCTEMQGRVVDQCLQLHGGYGIMWEYPISRAYADARVQRIYAGTNEIMKEIIARTL
jgi:alkylation response protein AidB-like acyl-CoA dehydrogenase